MPAELGKMNSARSTGKHTEKGILSLRAVPKRRMAVDIPPFSGHCRVGIGNDLHRLAEGRKLILGGVLHSL